MTAVAEDTELEIIDLGGDMTALAALNRSEIDVQIATAKRYPRSITKAKDRMIEMATMDKETAEKCGYALKRTDKDGKVVWIEGPSIRMAEIACSCWGNVRYGARVIEEGERFIVAQGVCHDLETNVYNAIEVRRRITGKSGRKYGDDMIGVTANAACSIAARNAVLKVVPRVVVNAAYEAAMKAAGGDERTFAERRDKAVATFKDLGVSLDELLKVLAKQDGGGVEDITAVDLRRLRGLYTAIQDGETTVDAVFRPQPQQPQPSPGEKLAADLTEQLRKRTPTSEGQKFEPTPEALAEAAMATMKIPPRPSDEDAERILRERSMPRPDPEPAAAEAAPVDHVDDDAEIAINELVGGDWPDVRRGILSAGTDAGHYKRGTLSKAIDGFVFKALGSSEGDKLPIERRRALYEAVVAGKLTDAGVIAP